MTLVTGTWVRADGTPDVGYVRFTLQPAARNSAGEQVTCTPVFAVLDETGSISVDLVPDPDLVGVSGTAVYEVMEDVGQCQRTWHLVIDGTGPIDLPSRYPGVVGSSAAVLPVPGPPGVPGPAGPTSARTSRPNGTDRLVEVWDGAAWVISQYDSGIRSLAGSLISGWTGVLHIRRIGPVIHLWAAEGLNGSAAASPAFLTGLHASFRPQQNAAFYFGTAGSSNILYGFATSGGSLSCGGNYAAVTAGALNTQWHTTAPVPTSLPGTPVGTAP